MNFLNELEMHLKSFESNAKAEIQNFITYVKSKYSEPAPAVVAPPAPIAPNGELTIGQQPVTSAAEVAPEAVEPAPEPVVEEVQPAAEVEAAPAESAEPTVE